jgi:hypothetical protein
MWLAQFVCAPQFFKTPKGLCGHTVYKGDLHIPRKVLYWVFPSVRADVYVLTLLAAHVATRVRCDVTRRVARPFYQVSVPLGLSTVSHDCIVRRLDTTVASSRGRLSTVLVSSWFTLKYLHLGNFEHLNFFYCFHPSIYAFISQIDTLFYCLY